MTTLNFPSSPTSGQVYANYIWDGEKWNLASNGASPSNASPQIAGTAAPGTSGNYSREDHVHPVGPTDTSRVAKSGDQMAGLLVTAGSGALVPNAGTTQSIQIKGDGVTPHAAITFHAPGIFATNFGMEGNGNFYMGGWSHGTNTAYQFWTSKDFSYLPPYIAGWQTSGVGTVTEFSAGMISSQGISGSSFSVAASPTNIANSTVFSATADHTNMAGSGTAPVASFAGITGAAQASFCRVNSTFLEDHTSSGTEHVALYAGARKYGSATTFASNIQVLDSGSGGTIVGLEIDVDGNANTGSSLGLGIYARKNPSVGSAFTGGNAILIDSSESNVTWARGIHLNGAFVDAGINTVYMSNTPVAVHMGNNQLLAWDGASPGTSRAWMRFNNAASRFEFYIDNNLVGHMP